MATKTLTKSKLSDFIKNNKSKIYESARQNTKLNSDNKPTISKDDDWFCEDIWDEHYKQRMIDKNENR